MKKLIISVPIALMLLTAGCGSEENYVPQLHTVLTVEPEQAGTVVEKNFSGVINEKATINLGFKTSGQIETISVKEGDYVRKGQLLATLDAKDYKLALESSTAKYEQLKNEVARMEKLYKSNSISGNDYEKAVSGFKQAGVQLQTDRNKVEYTRLSAPEDGLIQDVAFEPAEMVNAGTPVFTILSTGRMKVEVNLPQSIYQNRDKIKGVQCIINNKAVNIRMESFTPKADDTQLYKALFSIDGNRNITAGMNVPVKVTMTTGAKAENLTLPLRSVFEENGKTFVWVVGSDSVLKKTPVAVDRIDKNGDAIITGGLKGDETIVKAGVHSVKDGEKVKPQGKESETNIGGQL